MVPMHSVAQANNLTDITRQELMLGFYAFAGGFADATSYLAFKTFTGHVTGNLILLTIATVQHDWGTAAARLLAIICFLLATRAGFRLAAHPRSAIILFGCQAALLVVPAWLGLQQQAALLLGVAAFCLALGLQNGVVTSVLGVSVHSTFVSGDFTSLVKLPVAAPGQDQKQERTRSTLFVVTGSFFSGALSSALLHLRVPRLLPALLLLPLLCAALLQAVQTTASSSHRE